MYCRCYGRGHHLKDKRPNVAQRPGALWAIEGAHPGKERYEQRLRERLGAEADRWLDLASSEPINLTIFPNLLILGNHIQVLEPVSVNETDTVWYGTALVDGPDIPPGVAEDVNALRLRTQEGPELCEVDDLTIRGDPEGARRTGGRVGLHAPRHGHSRAHHHGRARHRHRAGDGRSVHAALPPPLERAHEIEPGSGRKARAMSYVDDAFYRDLAADFTDWQREDRRLGDPAVLEACRAMLHLEARLLDQGRFEDWLALFADACLFWIPGSPGGDPKREIAVAFDDRRQLEGRIFRLRTVMPVAVRARAPAGSSPRGSVPRESERSACPLGFQIRSCERRDRASRAERAPLARDGAS